MFQSGLFFFFFQFCDVGRRPNLARGWREKQTSFGLVAAPCFCFGHPVVKTSHKENYYFDHEAAKNLSQNKLQVARQGPTIYKVIYL